MFVEKWDDYSVPCFYYRHAGYIDQANATLYEFLPPTRVMNWNSKTAQGLLGISLNNAYRLWKIVKNDLKMSVKNFLKEVIKIISPEKDIPSIHALAKIEDSDKTGTDRQNCAICDKQSEYYCTACQAPMCYY